MSVNGRPSNPKTEFSATPAGAPRVMVKEEFKPVYEAELLDAQDGHVVIRPLNGEPRKTVRESQVWANGFDDLQP